MVTKENEKIALPHLLSSGKENQVDASMSTKIVLLVIGCLDVVSGRL